MADRLSHETDNELFSLLRGDSATSKRAFEELYARYSTGIYKYCLRVMGDQYLAEDVFQETFLRFHQSAQQERLMTNVEAFLLRIARNLCLNAKRNKHYSMVALDDLDVTLHDTPYENKEMERLVLMALESLPEDFKEVIVLREYNGLSYAEIAEVVGATVATVTVRIYRAKKKIQQILAPYLADLPE